MTDENIDDFLSSSERTNVRSTSLTCENYTLFSCPKEILDIFQRAANNMIAGGTVPSTFITPSLLSDMNLKSRLTALVRNSLFGVTALLVIAVTFPFFYLDGTTVPALIALASVLFLGFAYIGGYGYWYGKIRGSKVDHALSAKVDDNSTKVYWNTTVAVALTKSAMMYGALFFLYLSTPQIFYGIQRVLNKPAMAHFVQHATSMSAFNEINKALSHLERADYTWLPVIFGVEVLVYGAGIVLVTLWSLRIGAKEAACDVREAYRNYSDEQKYVFERGLKILQEGRP